MAIRYKLTKEQTYNNRRDKVVISGTLSELKSYFLVNDNITHINNLIKEAENKYKKSNLKISLV